MKDHLKQTRYVKLPRFADLTGYTEKAVRRKIEDGIWRVDREYVRAPDGHVLVDLTGFETWVESQSQGA